MSTDEGRPGGGVVESGAISSLPPGRRAILRCGTQAHAKVASAIGLGLPLVACTSRSRASLSVLWLGPDEWLLIAPESEGWMDALRNNLEGISCSAVEISDRQNALVVHGPRAETILASGCPLDLDVSEFPVGMCTRTLFHKAQIVLWRTAIDTFHLEVWRSFRSYVDAMLALAESEA